MDDIPLVDLRAAQQGVAEQVRQAFDRILGTSAFILGEDVARFESEFAAFLGARFCIGVANGTDALELALRALSVGLGDEVVLPVNTFIATAAAVVRCGAKPVFVDCDPDYLLLDVDQSVSRINPRTRAIIPVHLYGQMAPMELLSSLAERGLSVLEDAAQAHGAKRHGRSAGTFGAAAAFSFYPAKNLGAYGDGGAVVTDREDVREQVLALRNYGSVKKYHHPSIGFNSRLDALQAAVLRAKLDRLSAGNAARRLAAACYDEMLGKEPRVVLPRTLAGNEHVFHLYVVRVPRRDQVLERLHAQGIGAGIHYPMPLHLQGAFSNLGHRRGDFPVAERAADEILSLPLYPEITPQQQQRVVDALVKALA